jgi:hypothetical protein
MIAMYFQLIADNHNKFDSTEIDLFFGFIVVSCTIVCFYLKLLLMKEDRDSYDQQ